MKKRFHLILILIFTGFKLLSQNYYQISFEGSGLYENDSGHRFFIDTVSNVNNIWQIGSPQKNQFSSAYTLPNAIVTDLSEVYPSNDTSTFIIEHQANAGFDIPFEVILSGKYFVNSDTLIDYGKIEFSPNNGSTWIDLLDTTYASLIDWQIRPVLSGNSNGWSNFEARIQNLATLFNINSGDTVLYRFSFISDGIQTNKDGLMFDSLSVWDVPPLGIQNISHISKNFSVYPNPSSDYLMIDLSNQEVDICSIEIYNSSSEIVEEKKVPINQNKFSIDIKDYKEGIYFVSFITCDSFRVPCARFIKAN